MSNSRKKARGAYAPSVDDDSIPSLDGGWIKGNHYGADQVSNVSNRESSNPDAETANKKLRPSINLISRQASRVADERLMQNVDKGGDESPGETVGHAPRASDDVVPRDAADENQDAVDDKLMEATVKQIVGTLRQSYRDDKKRYQNAIQIAFRQRLSQIEEKATEQLRSKLHKARKKDKALIAEKDARLNDLLLQLSALAAEVDKQRAMVHKSSNAFEQKMIESDLVNSELQDLGRQLSKQAESLGNAMVDDRNKSAPRDTGPSFEPPRLNPRGK